MSCGAGALVLSNPSQRAAIILFHWVSGDGQCLGLAFLPPGPLPPSGSAARKRAAAAELSGCPRRGCGQRCNGPSVASRHSRCLIAVNVARELNTESKKPHAMWMGSIPLAKRVR